MADTPGSAPPNRRERLYGLLVLDGVDVALPLAAVREVLPCPGVLAGLPAVADGLLGAVEVRALVVPVLDVRSRLGLAAERDPLQVVVVVADGGRLLGLLADEVRGIVAVAEQGLLGVGSSAGGALFAEAFLHPQEGTVVSVLDPAVLLGLPGVPTLAEPAGGPAGGEGEGPSSSSTGQVGRARGGSTLTLLRCGGFVLGLDVEHVHTTLPGAPASPSVLAGPVCRGVRPYDGQDVPVVDLLSLLGLEPASEPQTGAGLVLQLNGGHVVADVAQLLDLVDVAAGDVLPLPGFAAGRPDLLQGLVELPGVGPCLVLDGPALRAESTLVALASLNTASESTDQKQVGAGVPAGVASILAAGPEYLVYTSGGIDLVTPLQQVVEILAWPPVLTAASVGSDVLGVTVHRRQAVPVVVLSAVLGLACTAPGPETCLLLVDVLGAPLALVVDGLRTIGRLTWRDPDHEPAAVVAPVDAVRSSPLVAVGGDPRLLPELDLQALAGLVGGRRGVTMRTTAAPSTAPAAEPMGTAGTLAHA